MLEGAAGAVIVDYRGLTVEQDTQLRKHVKGSWGCLQGIQEYFD